jgi:putative endonuclease
VLARNHESPAGEIDLVCSCGSVIVFIEVKTRTSFDAQNPTEAARPVQWRRIERAAKLFLRRFVHDPRPIRFDLITVEWPKSGTPHIEHQEAAYHPSFA